MRISERVENGLEIYRNEKGQVKVLITGEKVEYTELPSILRELFQAELIADKAAIKCLHEMKIMDADEMEIKFVGCRYGAIDNMSNLNGHNTYPDAPTCSEIKTCQGFNILCKVPKGKNGTLSRQEYLIVTLVSIGKLDKEIADELKIEISTIRTHLARIHEKLRVNNRIEIAFWAMNKGII